MLCALSQGQEKVEHSCFYYRGLRPWGSPAGLESYVCKATSEGLVSKQPDHNMLPRPLEMANFGPRFWGSS